MGFWTDIIFRIPGSPQEGEIDVFAKKEKIRKNYSKLVNEKNCLLIPNGKLILFLL